MLTTDELLDPSTAKQKVIRVHGMELLLRLLKNDWSRTWYGCGADGGSYWEDLQQAARRTPPEKVDHEFARDRVRRTIEVREEEGAELDVDAYLGNDPRVFWSPRKLHRPGIALSLAISMSISSAERNGSDMARRHEDCYRRAAAAEAEGRPCRVIGVFGVVWRHHGAPNDPTQTWIVTIKDWRDPLYPFLWGCLSTNKTCNSTLNLIADLIVGTDHYGNGTPQEIRLSPSLPPGEEPILIEPYNKVTL